MPKLVRNKTWEYLLLGLFFLVYAILRAHLAKGEARSAASVDGPAAKIR